MCVRPEKCARSWALLLNMRQERQKSFARRTQADVAGPGRKPALGSYLDADASTFSSIVLRPDALSRSWSMPWLRPPRDPGPDASPLWPVPVRPNYRDLDEGVLGQVLCGLLLAEKLVGDTGGRCGDRSRRGRRRHQHRPHPRAPSDPRLRGVGSAPYVLLLTPALRFWRPRSSAYIINAHCHYLPYT